MRIKDHWVLLFLTLFLVSARTDRIILDQPQDFEPGKFKASVLSSQGKIFSGKLVEEIKLEESAVWSLLELKPELILLGTGNKARLYQYEKGKLEQIFEDKDRLAITAIAQSKTGEVYFASIPKATVYKLMGKTVNKVAEPGVEYIWTLVPMSDGILAGAGPKGKIFLIQPQGKVSKVLELNAEQVVEIIEVGKGEYLAGTARPGMLVSFKLDGSYRVLNSFREEELRAIRKLSDQSLLLALNQGGIPAMPAPEPEGPPPGMSEAQSPEQAISEEEQGAQPQISPRMGPGGSVVYQFYPDRGIKQILSLKQATILSLSGDEQNGFFLGTDDQGRVYQIFPFQNEFWLSYDLEPAKIVSFAGNSSGLHFIGTAQPARLIRIKEGATDASYQSKVLDARFPSDWGRIDWRGKGRVKFFTRTGNIPQADGSWSKWEEVEGPELKIKSPIGRYLQFRAEWSSLEKVEIERVEISYKNLNQAHYIVELKVDVAPGAGEGRTSASRGGESASGQKSASSVLKQCQISWRIENPDQDSLSLGLYFQQEGNSLWVRIAKEDEIKGNFYQWDASELPDGWYRIRLTASDRPSNSEPEAFTTEQISSLILIDTSKPELKFTVKENLVSGEVQDQTSAINKLEYALNDAEFRPLLSLDRVLDQKQEKFELRLKNLARGTHLITIRACDQAGNCQTQAQEFQIK